MEKVLMQAQLIFGPQVLNPAPSFMLCGYHPGLSGWDPVECPVEYIGSIGFWPDGISWVKVDSNPLRTPLVKYMLVSCVY
jgi:hypothetical protein